MYKKLSLPRDVMLHMLPLGTSVPCRVVASVILAVLTGASVAAPVAPSAAATPSAPQASFESVSGCLGSAG
jgi:hypothetical protein